MALDTLQLVKVLYYSEGKPTREAAVTPSNGIHFKEHSNILSTRFTT